MDSSKKPKHNSSLSTGFPVHPKLFVFLDKKNGVRRFDVRANEDGSMPLDQAASLLAMHCLARHQSPREFIVMVQAGQDVAEGLAGRATKLIRTFIDTKNDGSALSHRQREVLDGVTQNLSNKEIAARLNLSERTVKFHVSALLEKFAVRTRVDLLLHAVNDAPIQDTHARHSEFVCAHREPWKQPRPVLRRTTGKSQESGGQDVSPGVPLNRSTASGTSTRPS